jgi:type VI protein secretion system component Hcp
MATARKKSKKQVAVKDLKPKDARRVKGGDTATTKTQVSEFQITKTVDKSSPTLFK